MTMKKKPASTIQFEERLAQLEANQAAIMACLGQIAQVIGQLEFRLNSSGPLPWPDPKVASVPTPLPTDDGADLVDIVWDAFAFNADAYAFWHNPHPALGGKSPKDLAQDPTARIIVLQLIAEILAGK